jgi:endonuclease/exonuclease/phosphatase family metal-dependent hydrolase
MADGKQPLVAVLHWNVHSWRDEDGSPAFATIAGVIADQDPDVISLTEVNEPWAAPGRLADLAQRGGWAWIFAPAVELGDGGPARGYGNALLTRLPVLAVQQWGLTWPPSVYDGTEPSEQRTVALARVATPSGPLWVGSTHLPSTSPAARLAALGRLRGITAELADPWLICGDFNTGPREWIGPGGDWQVRPDPPQPTHPASDPVRMIDYCVAAPGLEVTADVLPATGSDHLPVVVRCRIPPR